MYSTMITRPQQDTTADVSSTWIPTKPDYWVGFDTYCECAITGDFLDEGELASLTHAERRGYDYAAECAAAAETIAWMDSHDEPAIEDDYEWIRRGGSGMGLQ
jgi:hypothetical protein